MPKLAFRVMHSTTRVLLIPVGWNKFRREENFDSLIQAAELAADAAIQNVLIPGPEPSDPGDPPHRQTGQGASAIEAGWDPGQATSYVGVDRSGEHMWQLEWGTRWVAKRPWLMPALEGNRPLLERTINERLF